MRRCGRYSNTVNPSGIHVCSTAGSMSIDTFIVFRRSLIMWAAFDDVAVRRPGYRRPRSVTARTLQSRAAAHGHRPHEHRPVHQCVSRVHTQLSTDEKPALIIVQCGLSRSSYPFHGLLFSDRRSDCRCHDLVDFISPVHLQLRYRRCQQHTIHRRSHGDPVGRRLSLDEFQSIGRQSQPSRVSRQSLIR